MHRCLMEGIVMLAPDYGNGGMAVPEAVEGKATVTAPEVAGVSATVEGGAVSAVDTATTNESAGRAQEVQSPAWMAQLPKELRNDPELAKHRSMGDAIRYLKSQAEGNVAQPVSEAKEDGADGERVPVRYENFAVSLSEGNDPFGEITHGLTEELQSMGIPQDRAEALLRKLDGLQDDATKRFVDESKKYTESICRRNWGKEYESKRTLMAKGYQALGDNDGSLQKSLDESGASLSPAVWEIMSRVGRMVSEDKAVGSQRGSGVTDRDPNCPVAYRY